MYYHFQRNCHGRGLGFESRRPRHLFPQIGSTAGFDSFSALPYFAFGPGRYHRFMPVWWKNHIVSDPEILRGKPRLKGTRIPVGLVLGYLAAGKSVEDMVAEFPDLTRDQIAACLDYARELAEFEAVV